MYSLYRAWLGATTSDEQNYSPRLMETTCLSLPPDTLIRVGNDGEYHFVAHRAVLAAHSGYLKALLAAATTTTTIRRDNNNVDDGGGVGAVADNTTTPIISSITLPSTIGGEAFAPLLNYMYTGRLEVTLDNIYTVLLATHLLHMPGALEQCRAALLRLRPPVIHQPPPPPPPPPTNSPPSLPPSSSTDSTSHRQINSNVLRPVPNRLLGPSFYPGHHHLYPPPIRHVDALPRLTAAALHQLPSSSSSPLTVVHPAAQLAHKLASYGAKERSISPASNCSQTAQQLTRSPQTSPELVVASSASSVTQRSDNEQQQQQQQSNQEPSSPSTSSERISIGDETQIQYQHQQQQSTSSRRRRQKQRINRQAERSASSSNNNYDNDNEGTTLASGGDGGGPSQTPGVVYDVACCDGPVRFHRVLNENYAPTADTNTTRVSTMQCNGRAIAEDATTNHGRENDENDEHRQQSRRHSRTPTQLINNNNNNNNTDTARSVIYTCGYCQHTFKSQYCYRKHARRHLLPTEGEKTDSRRSTQSSHSTITTVTTTTTPTPSTLPSPLPVPRIQTSHHQTTLSSSHEVKKREVRLLDLNVQYYPCKICGSKFPSYYFVHKHRKLCHANVDEPTTTTTRSNGSNNNNNSVDYLQQQVTRPSKQSEQQQPSTSEGLQPA